MYVHKHCIYPFLKEYKEIQKNSHKNTTAHVFPSAHYNHWVKVAKHLNGDKEEKKTNKQKNST